MKVFCSLLSLFLFAVSAFSQDCNGTYEGGLALLKKRTEASVKEAVRKFESAKRCYKVNRDQQGVQNCDEQITACKQILNYFTQQTAKVTAEESYEFPEAGGEQIIPVKTKRSWSFSGVHGHKGERRIENRRQSESDNGTPLANHHFEMVRQETTCQDRAGRGGREIDVE